MARPTSSSTHSSRDALDIQSASSPPRSATSHVHSFESSSGPVRWPRRTVYVAVPLVFRSQKERYRYKSESTFVSGRDLEDTPMEVVGEYTENGQHFYFAKLEDGLAHRFIAKDFRRDYRSLVAAYEQDKVDRQLTPFDPSASYVHPGSRVKVTIKIDKSRSRSASHSHDLDLDLDLDLDELGDVEVDDEAQDESFSEEEVPRRHVPSRAVREKFEKELPFSPKKTRSKPVPIVIQDSEDDEASEAEVRTTRPTRSQKPLGPQRRGSDYQDGENEDSGSDYQDRAQISKKKRVKGIPPACGTIRDVSDLPFDFDEETAPLRAHREVCERCKQRPAHFQFKKLKKRAKKGKGRRKKKDDEESSEDEDERVQRLGGWIRCLKCPVSAHWGCLAATQHEEILRATLEKERASWLQNSTGADGLPSNEGMPTKRPALEMHETTEFLCGSCSKGGVCMGCFERVPAAQPTAAKSTAAEKIADVEMADTSAPAHQLASSGEEESGRTQELLFRCFTCKRPAHYAHLPPIPDAPDVHDDDDLDLVASALYYQETTDWLCAGCYSYVYPLDKILAWRPYPPDSAEPSLAPGEVPDIKQALPREYLVKWVDRSYRRTEWVPHLWLLATNRAKLKNFVGGGAKVELLAIPVPESVTASPAGGDEEEVQEGSGPVDALTSMMVSEGGDTDDTAISGKLKVVKWSDPLPDAERRIPLAWKTIGRVLDVLLFNPTGRVTENMRAKKRRDKANRHSRRVQSDEEPDSEMEAERAAAFEHGEQPSEDLTQTVEDWQRRQKRQITTDDIDDVIWGIFKWDDLGYEEATWDSPPRRGELGFPAFEAAFKRFIAARHVPKPRGPVPTEKDRPKGMYKRKYALPKDGQPDLGQHKDFKLMDFQIDGFNWLCNNWWNMQHCILADEMGLGKTVQIATFLGTIINRWKAYPALVVVPNSTISNWVRELERWAPNLTVVPYYGDARARACIAEYELKKFHVLVTTYEAVTTGKDFGTVFKNKNLPRWEVLVLDEGQRLKNDKSLTFKKLNELNTVHRVIMTGTPLNNNIRELFNLMNFLDPNEWRDLEKLEAEHEELTEELVKELHNRLRPYFLRRIKSEVLSLPPKNEVIVPVSMTPLQKEIYRSILKGNLDVLRSLSQASKFNSAATTKTNMNNVLMQLRKCLQHPYLVSNDIEPRNLPAQETHDKLIEASTKLRFLKTLLPKLKERGHRVLLFSQFVIALDVVEDFLQGEGLKYLRLDGNTKQGDRQKGMDKFNSKDSDIFIYLLTTRAGGVGINLWSADTVIIFDPDFNPHQDLQAIARAHRYGQEKTVLVFKLMVKYSAEERIMQTGKKKLVLDHLIVQKMDDEETGGDDVQSILMFGAQALFNEDEDQTSRDITYSETDIEKLIEKTEQEGESNEEEKSNGLSFAFAKVWAAEKDSLEAMADELPDEQVDSWVETLKRIEAEHARARAEEVTGRGVKRRAAVAAGAQMQPSGTNNIVPIKQKGKGKKSKTNVSDDDADMYSVKTSDRGSNDSDSDDSVGFVPDDRELLHASREQAAVNNAALPECSLCGTRHSGACYMTQSSDNLAQYRLILMENGGDEPWEARLDAIHIIDETLFKRGHIDKIRGQPLHLLGGPGPDSIPNRPGPPRKKAKTQDKVDTEATTTDLSRLSVNEPTAAVGAAPTVLPNGSSATGSKNAISGPSKRPSSPLPSDKLLKSKKPKFASCPLCSNTPSHPLEICPVVREGPTRISHEIKRLGEDPVQGDTVNTLRKLLSKIKKRELADVQQRASVVPIE